MKLSTLASLAGYSAARIRQLADAEKIPAMRALHREKYRVRWFQDGPALRDWIADAQANKGKHWPKQSSGGSKKVSSVPVNVSSAPMQPDPALERFVEQCKTMHAPVVTGYAEALKSARRTIEAAVMCGLYLEGLKAKRSWDDFNKLVQEHLPHIKPDEAKRFLRISKNAHRWQNWSDRRIFYQVFRFNGMTAYETREAVRKMEQLKLLIANSL